MEQTEIKVMGKSAIFSSLKIGGGGGSVGFRIMETIGNW